MSTREERIRQHRAKRFAREEAKREGIAERQRRRKKRSDKEQLDLLAQRPGESRRETARLKKRLEKSS